MSDLVVLDIHDRRIEPFGQILEDRTVDDEFIGVRRGIGFDLAGRNRPQQRDNAVVVIVATRPGIVDGIVKFDRNTVGACVKRAERNVVATHARRVAVRKQHRFRVVTEHIGKQSRTREHIVAVFAFRNDFERRNGKRLFVNFETLFKTRVSVVVCRFRNRSAHGIAARIGGNDRRPGAVDVIFEYDLRAVVVREFGLGLIRRFAVRPVLDRNVRNTVRALRNHNLQSIFAFARRPLHVGGIAHGKREVINARLREGLVTVVFVELCAADVVIVVDNRHSVRVAVVNNVFGAQFGDVERHSFNREHRRCVADKREVARFFGIDFRRYGVGTGERGNGVTVVIDTRETRARVTEHNVAFDIPACEVRAFRT